MVSFFAFNMFEFVALNRMFAKAKSLDEGRAWVFSVDNQKVKNRVIELNTVDQLGEHGIDALGSSLGEYRPFTINEKKRKGQITDHITFKDTGGYWRSWRVIVTRNSIEIEVDDLTFNELIDIRGSWENHVGVTNENIDKLISELVLPKYQEYARRELFS